MNTEWDMRNKRVLGINGVGRIGKLTLWNHLNMKHFDGIVVNAGRMLGRQLEDAVHYMTTDSTYGMLDHFLHGYSGKSCDVKILNKEEAIMEMNGIPVRLLTKARNPKDIDWAKYGVQVVVDCTGVFLDPALPADHPKGSLRGHLAAGAKKVIASAPFKRSDTSQPAPEDSGIFVYGVNHSTYDPKKQHILSSASCTTTGLAHMIKPIMETEETSKIITASMTTVHAATNTQNILDAPPKTDAKDLRRNRAVFDSLIPTSTGAAATLVEVIPEIKTIGFMADAIRVPTTTVSLILLDLTFSTSVSEKGEPVIDRDFVNNIFKKAAAGAQKGLLVYSENQNVSVDLKGLGAAVVIEGRENQVRTGFLTLDRETPVTHAKLLGWYDNEYGSFVNCMGNLTRYVDQNLL
ncbi:MAG TPA: glyceraldehyde-3-phosphate dehydrogenase [Clostridiales bacterium]|nr:glyceraldehyde-3-phosphate dehydrogenase [Clostridiales bacterium]